MSVTDIRVATRIFDDIKIKRLIKIHGNAGFVGLMKLWIYTAEQAPTGVLIDLADDEIPLITDVQAHEFLETLFKLNLVSRDSDGNIKITNWDVHQTWVIDAPKRAEHARKASKARWRSKFKNESKKLETEQ